MLWFARFWASITPTYMEFNYIQVIMQCPLKQVSTPFTPKTKPYVIPCSVTIQIKTPGGEGRGEVRYNNDGNEQSPFWGLEDFFGVRNFAVTSLG